MTAIYVGVDSLRQWKGQHRRQDLVWGWASIAALSTLLVASLFLVFVRGPSAPWDAAVPLLNVALGGTGAVLHHNHEHRATACCGAHATKALF